MSQHRQTNELAPDADIMLRHLELLYGMEPEGKFDLVWSGEPFGPPRNHKIFDVSELEEAAEEAANHNAVEGVHVYIRPAILSDNTAPFGAVSDADVSHTRHVWSDFDEKHDMRGAAKIYSICRPNFIVMTGQQFNGEERPMGHMYWSLDDQGDEYISHQETLRTLLKGIAARFQSDTSVVNPSRMMRLAGSVNWSNKKGRVYERTELYVYDDRPKHTIKNLARFFLKKTKAKTRPQNKLTIRMREG